MASEGGNVMHGRAESYIGKMAYVREVGGAMFVGRIQWIIDPGAGFYLAMHPCAASYHLTSEGKIARRMTRMLPTTDAHPFLIVATSISLPPEGAAELFGEAE